MFSYHANRDGSLDAPPIDNIPNIASSAGVINTLVVSNLEEYQFSPDLAHLYLPTNQPEISYLEISFKLQMKLATRIFTLTLNF